MSESSDTDSPGGAGASSGQYTWFGDELVREDRKAERVGRVFTSVARRYDLMNDLMSGGLHRLWKDAFVSWLAPGAGARPWHHLDIAGGTGDIAFRVLGAAGTGTTSLVVDINPSMLAAALRRPEAGRFAGRVAFAAGDAEQLPVADGSLDAVTIAFGIRNVTHIEHALAAARRALRHGGRFMCLEFSQVSVPVLDGIYDAYCDRVIPALGQAVAGDGAAYRYLVESIRRFPPQGEFAAMIERAGFQRVRWRDLSGGIAAMHSAWRL